MSDWVLSYQDYNADHEGLREALCALGNGYFVTRGAGPESHNDKVHYPGTYLAGGYDRQLTKISDRDIENEDLVNLPNWLPLTIKIADGNWFSLDHVELLDYRQELNVQQGLLIRDMRFRDAQGHTTRWQERRFVSMADQHLAGLEIQLSAENWSGKLSVRTALDGSVTNDGVARYRELNGNHLETLTVNRFHNDIIWLRSRTRQSRLEIVEAARTKLYSGNEQIDTERHTHRDADQISQVLTVDLKQGEKVTVEKIVALYTSQDAAVSEPGLEATNAVVRASRFSHLLEQHQLTWRQLWSDCDLSIMTEDGDGANLKLRVHVFHLLQTVSAHSIDRDVGVPARGWHGEAYRGHIFWDELFIFPFLNLRLPVLTRALLRYRHRRLPAARRAAQDAGFAGAMYPWQSGSDGREESQKIHLNPQSGRWIPDNTYRQRHINGAIAYNVWQYYQVTEDHEFLRDYGAEMVLEIARFWASIVTYNEAIDRYEIRDVMGPDEYHTAYPDADPNEGGGLHNNAYTNVMASWVLNRAQDVLELLPSDVRQKLCERIGLQPEEIAGWDEISRKLRVAFHEDGIISQFEGYGDLQEFDWQAYREKYGDIQRLDRILEAEGDSPNRYKASKQADVLMLFYLFSADELTLLFERLGYPFEGEQIPRNIDYYIDHTSHGSTLSWMVHSWVMARTQRPEAWSLFNQALKSDISDIQGGTTPEGIHLGAMAGTVDLAQRCFMGIETRAGILYFNPALPQALRCLKTSVRYRQHTLQITIDHDNLTIASHQTMALPITIAYRGHYRKMSPGECYTFRLIKPADRNRDENRAPHRTESSSDRAEPILNA
jgi:alpha,alpha-trehalase